MTVQQALDQAGVDGSPLQKPSRPAPSLGMRGGLGKTLLIAFLLLTIIPLALLAFLTYNQIRRDTAQKLAASLETMVVLQEAHLVDWVASYERELSLLADALDPAADLAVQLGQLRVTGSTWANLILVDPSHGTWLASTEPGATQHVLEELVMEEWKLRIAPAPEASDQALVALSYDWADRRLIGLLPFASLQKVAASASAAHAGVSTYLITDDALMVSAQGLTRFSSDQQGTLAHLLAGHNGFGAYANPQGIPVFGAYRWNPELQIALLAEQSETQALETGNTLTAMVVGATLAVALITAAIAAVVTRRITRPIVQLTETAAWMARGDLNQQVPVTRRDEIGVLARAFNRMAAELRVLYGNLEAKVAERTQQLEEANERSRHHAMQLALSAEVARVVSSIRDLDSLLTMIAQLIGDAFELQHVSIYLLERTGDLVEWQGGRDDASPPPAPVPVGDDSLIGLVAAGERRQVIRASDALSGGGLAVPPPGVACEMAIPLRSRERLLGVLDLQSARPYDFGADDQMVYQSLADQISVAIENAQAYAVERETVQKLKELDRIQGQFLSNMSHALRTPLTSILGFSQMMLNEYDGPLTDLQRADVSTIYEGGRQLLGLLNDMLELTQLELGTAPFTPGVVDLAEIVEGVTATARALARGKPVRLYEELPENLPPMYTDGQRVRQVILALLSNAVKFTEEGSIRLRVTADHDRVTISVTDAGSVLSQAEQDRLFSDAPADLAGEDMRGFGLAISKRVVERLGGEIWVESDEKAGSTFTFALPVRQGQEESGNGGKGNVETA